MEDNSMPSNETEQPKRPLGLWFLMIYTFLFTGLFSLGLAIYLWFSGFMDITPGVNRPSLIIGALISLAIIYFSVQVWLGKEKARKIFIVLIIVNYLLVGINNFLIIQAGVVNSEEETRLWGQVLRSLIYPAFYVWYLNRPVTKQFFHD